MPFLISVDRRIWWWTVSKAAGGSSNISNEDIFSHIIYCLPIWSLASVTSLKPLQSLYKRTVTILDKKPSIFHHCPILQKYRLLSWGNMVKYSNLCLVYKMIHGLSSPPLHQFVTIRTADHSRTRGAARGD